MKFYLGTYEKLGIPGADSGVTLNAVQHYVQMSYCVMYTNQQDAQNSGCCVAIATQQPDVWYRLIPNVIYSL